MTQILININIFTVLTPPYLSLRNRAMYVCLCKGITDSQIKEAVYDGATSVGQLRKCLGVASQCGKCGITAREIIQETLADVPASNGYPQYYAVA